MALVTCPDCAKEVSDQAPACLSCGRPMQVATVQAQAAEPLTIQQTSKKYKLAKLLAMLCFLGMFISYDSKSVAATFGVVGLALFLYGALGRWWQND